jgi:hypothetical protein
MGAWTACHDAHSRPTPSQLVSHKQHIGFSRQQQMLMPTLAFARRGVCQQIWGAKARGPLYNLSFQLRRRSSGTHMARWLGVHRRYCLLAYGASLGGRSHATPSTRHSTRPHSQGGPAVRAARAQPPSTPRGAAHRLGCCDGCCSCPHCSDSTTSSPGRASVLPCRVITPAHFQ